VNPFRAQLPVYSPLTLGALGTGLLAALGAGQARRRVEQALRAQYAPHGLLLTDSGTSALALALRLAVAERPGPVALPAYCCYDVATAVDAAGVPFLLYDLDPATLGPDEASLRAALAAGAGTVVVVHLYGVPVDVPAVRALASERGTIIVDDAAQGAGASIGGRPAGMLGRFGVLSFGRGKGVTGGSGGTLLAAEPTAAAAVAGIGERLAPPTGGARAALALTAQWALARPALYGLPLSIPALGLGETIYRPPHPPRRCGAFPLGVLSRMLPLAEAEAARRRANAGRLRAALAGARGVSAIQPSDGSEPGWLRLPLRLAVGDARESVAVARAKRLGVWPGYPRSLADLAGFGGRRCNAGTEFPGALELASRLVTLPTHGRLAPHDVAALEAWIVKRG